VATNKNNLKWFYVAFILSNLVLSCYYMDVWITPNATSRALPVVSRYEYHTIAIDKFKDFTGDKSQINGHYYSDKAPVSTMIVYPFYVMYKFLGLKDISDAKLKEFPIYIWDKGGGIADGRTFLCPQTSPVFLIGDILCGCLPFLISVLVTFWALRNQPTKISPVCLAVLPFYGSYLFSYAGTYTGHLLAGFFLFLGYLFLKEKKWFLVSGIAAGIAFATEYPIGIIFPIWIVLIYLNEKSFIKILLFIAGVAPGVLFVLWYNHHITGSSVTTSYSYVSNAQYEGVSNLGFSYPKLAAIWGLIFSTYRGLFFYAPVLIVMVFYLIIQNWKNLVKNPFVKSGSTFLKSYFGVTLTFYILLISSHAIWWGGWAFGPRHLIPVALIALYEGIIYLSKKSFSPYFFYAASIVGIWFAWMDKSTRIYMIPEGFGNVFYGNPVFDLILPDFMKSKFNANTLPTFIFDTSPSFSVYFWPVLFTASILFLSWWYSKLKPVIPEPIIVKPKVIPKKLKKK
jgi:hypothetical protein